MPLKVVHVLNTSITVCNSCNFTFELPVRVTVTVLRLIPIVVLDWVLEVRGPGLVTVLDAKRKEVPLISISSSSTLLENMEHEVRK